LRHPPMSPLVPSTPLFRSQVVGRGDRSRKIAREDAGDALSLEAPGQPLGLGHAAGRERVVGKLDGARRIAQRLAVADEEDGHEADRKSTRLNSSHVAISYA